MAIVRLPQQTRDDAHFEHARAIGALIENSETPQVVDVRSVEQSIPAATVDVWFKDRSTPALGGTE